MKTHRPARLAGRGAGRPDPRRQGAGAVRRSPGAGRDDVRRAQARLDQRIALLRHVEALRLYAAEHDGALPANLSEISVPLPDDPFTGKPFRYEVTGDTAHLRGTPPPGAENEPELQRPLRGHPSEMRKSSTNHTTLSCSLVAGSIPQ